MCELQEGGLLWNVIHPICIPLVHSKRMMRQISLVLSIQNNYCHANIEVRKHNHVLQGCNEYNEDGSQNRGYLGLRDPKIASARDGVNLTKVSQHVF